MNKYTQLRFWLLVVAVAMVTTAVVADSPKKSVQEPTFTADGKLLQPTDYREWIFLSSGLDMSYNAKALASKEPVFDNVFVNPEAYRAFLQTGTWPEKTQLVMEARSSTSKGSINRLGHFQNGDIQGIEVHVKDTARFEGGWAFFDIQDNAPATQIPMTADCYTCHRAHAAVDTTFVQFYPTLLPIAQKHATLSASYLKDEAELAKTVH